MRAALIQSVVCIASLASYLTGQTDQRRLMVHESIRVQRKIALVIGNQAYQQSPLKNPVKDAAAIAEVLRSMGFDEVIERHDLTIRTMRQEVNRFAAKLEGGDLGLFYFAGHGVQANEQNYLIATDFAGTSEADLEYEAYPASQVRDKIEQSGARLRILVLDACRNNPFRSKRDGVRGLVSMGSAVEGTYIAFATADNSVADDNPGESNGLFTKYLLSALRTPGLDLKQIFEKTKQDVYVASQRKQRPFTYDGVIGQFYFNGSAPIVNTQPTISPADLAAQEEIAFWSGIDKNDLESVLLYVQRYPNGRFALLAQRGLTKLRSAIKQVPSGVGTTPDSKLDAKPNAAPAKTAEFQTTTLGNPAFSTERLLVGEFEDVYFDRDSDEISQDSKATLARDGQLIRQLFAESSQAIIVIEGYSEDGLLGEAGLRIGEQRSRAAKDLLVKQGLPANRFTIISYGSERLICVEQTEQCRQRNQRVHLRAEK